MRLKHLSPFLFLLPLSAFCQIEEVDKTLIFSPLPVAKNTVEQFHSNEDKPHLILKNHPRTRDVPTQIIRTEATLDGQNLRCEEVTNTINETLLAPITSDLFIYNTYVSCSYDPETNLATQFSINSYFDPISDEAVDYLNKYLEQKNGINLLGTTVKVEPAKGLIIAINIMAGVVKNPNKPPFMQYRQDRSNFSFKSNYEMKTKFLTDLYQNFYSDDATKILPFLSRWIDSSAEFIYYSVLIDANYVELQPERIYLMENEGDIFVSRLRYYFAHQCYKHEHHHCIKRG